MQEKHNSGKNLLVTIVILAAVVIAGYFYATRDRSSDVLLTSVLSSDAPTGVQGDLLSVLRQLKTLKLDDSIFQDPVWNTLHDFGQTLSPQPSFRQNPFAPLNAAADFSSTTTTQTTR